MRKIRLGMTLDQAEALLGGPPRDETAGEPWSFEPGTLKLVSDRVEVWGAPTCTVWVGLKDGRVATFSIADRPQEPILDRLRRWVGL